MKTNSTVDLQKYYTLFRTFGPRALEQAQVVSMDDTEITRGSIFTETERKLVLKLLVLTAQNKSFEEFKSLLLDKRIPDVRLSEKELSLLQNTNLVEKLNTALLKSKKSGSGVLSSFLAIPTYKDKKAS